MNLTLLIIVHPTQLTFIFAFQQYIAIGSFKDIIKILICKLLSVKLRATTKSKNILHLLLSSAVS